MNITNMNPLTRTLKESEEAFDEKFVNQMGGVMPKHRDGGRILKEDLKLHLKESQKKLLGAVVEMATDLKEKHEPAYGKENQAYVAALQEVIKEIKEAMK